MADVLPSFGATCRHAKATLPMMAHRLPTLLLLLGPLWACTPKVPPGVGSVQPPSAGPVDAATTAIAPGVPAAPVSGMAWVLGTALVRIEPSDAKDIAGPGKRGKKSNWIATLYRGEQVRVLQDQPDWLQVRLSDERVGWLKADNLLVGDGVRQATVLSRCHSFTRPDLLALNGSRTLEPGALLFVIRDKDPFSEINWGGRQSAWVLTAWLVSDAPEVDAAKLIHRARLLQERKDPGAAAMIDLAKNHFGQTRLMQALMAAQTPAAPAPADAVPPAPSPTGDSPAMDTAARDDLGALQLTNDGNTEVDTTAPSGGAPGLQNMQVTPIPVAPAPSPDPFESDSGGLPQEVPEP